MSIERPFVLLESRRGAAVAGSRQEAIGRALLSQDITPIFAGPDELQTEADAITDYRILDLDTRTLVAPGSDMPAAIRPDAWRLRDIPDENRPPFARSTAQGTESTPGYNNGALCARLATRMSLRELMPELGLKYDKNMNRSFQIDPGSVESTLDKIEGDRVFLKPFDRHTDVHKPDAHQLLRSRYLPRDQVARYVHGPAYLEPNIAAPASTVLERFGLSPNQPTDDFDLDSACHTIRLYQTTGFEGAQTELAELRLLAPEHVGRPEPCHSWLFEPAVAQAALKQTGVWRINEAIGDQIGDRYGMNFIAVDYFLADRGRTQNAMVDDILVRPWLPEIKDHASWKTVEIEADMLRTLAVG